MPSNGQFPHFRPGQSDAVVLLGIRYARFNWRGQSTYKVRCPDDDAATPSAHPKARLLIADVLVVFYGLSSQELQSRIDGPIVCVALRHIAMPCGQVTRDQTDRGVEQVEPNADTAFVA